MKLPFYGAFVVLVSCYSDPSTPAQKPTAAADSITLPKSEKANAWRKKLYVTDSVALDDFNGKLRGKYSAAQFNEVIDHFPTLYDTITVHPDSSYSRSDLVRTFIDSTGKQREISFESEAGQDDYYMLYAYFLRKRNGKTVLAGRRDTLVRTYRLINNIFDEMEHGGSYFGRQLLRILGYAEYDLHVYLQHKQDTDPADAYNKSKEQYLQALRQEIMDGIKDDDALNAAAKRKLQESLLEKAAAIETLITDRFYLQSVDAFQHACYPLPL